MAIVHPHNLRRPDAGIQRPYGVRITLKNGDPFRKLLGADWNKTHWYGTAAARDAHANCSPPRVLAPHRQARPQLRQGREAPRVPRTLKMLPHPSHGGEA